MKADNETRFEEHIEKALLASPLYISRKPSDFDERAKRAWSGGVQPAGSREATTPFNERAKRA